jgi:hypothetical protein
MPFKTDFDVNNDINSISTVVSITDGATLTNTAYVDFSPSITFTIPEDGKWEINFQLHGKTGGTGFIAKYRLVNVTGGNTVVSNSESLTTGGQDVTHRVSSNKTVIVTTTGATTYKIQGAVNSGTLTLDNATNEGSSEIVYKKLSGYVPNDPARDINIVRFTSNGTYTPTLNTKFIIVEMVGGGGSAGGAPATTLATQGSVGAGGAAGAYLKFLATDVQIGASQTITIGAGGVGVAGSAGGAGGTTTFGTLAICTGGAGGNVAGPSTVSEEIGSTASGTSVTLNAGTLIKSTLGQRGGSSSTIVNITTGFSICGQGGNTPLGLPFPNSFSIGIANLTSVGATSENFGCGSGGTCSSGSVQVAKTGITGQPGVVIIYEYFY